MAKRKVPIRTCLGCRTARPKKELMRVVRTPEEKIEIDPKGKRPGRGAYICPELDCLEQAVKRKQLERALKCSVPPALKEELERYLDEQPQTE